MSMTFAPRIACAFSFHYGNHGFQGVLPFLWVTAQFKRFFANSSADFEPPVTSRVTFLKAQETLFALSH
jgi:hypothetical protein